MQANQDNAIWISNTFSQGPTETDWQECQREVTVTGVADSAASLITRHEFAYEGNNPPDLLVPDGAVGKKAASPHTEVSNPRPYFANDAGYSTFATGQGGNILAASTDGTVMFVFEASTETMREYRMATGWDIANATLEDSHTFSPTRSYTDFAISSDGTKLYMVSVASKTVYQFSLGTGWDLGTIVDDAQSLDVSTEVGVGTPVAVAINDDGTEVYVVDGVDDIHIYTMTAYTLSTASFSATETGLFTHVYGLQIGDYGRRLYYISSVNLYSFELATPGDVTSLIASGVLAAFRDVSNITSTPRGFHVDSSAGKVLLADSVGTIYRFDLTSTFYEAGDPSYASVFEELDAAVGSAAGWVLGDSGTKLYVLDQNDRLVYQYALPTPYNVASRFGAADSDSGLLPADVYGLAFSKDGTVFYVITTGSRLYSYTLSTAWDISTATQSGTYLNTVSETGAIACTDKYIFYVYDNNYVRVIEPSDMTNLSSSVTDHGGILLISGPPIVTALWVSDDYMTLIGGELTNPGGFAIWRLQNPDIVTTATSLRAYYQSPDLTDMTGSGISGIMPNADGSVIWFGNNQDRAYKYNFSAPVLGYKKFDLSSLNLSSDPASLYTYPSVTVDISAAYQEDLVSFGAQEISSWSSFEDKATFVFDNDEEQIFSVNDQVSVTSSQDLIDLDLATDPINATGTLNRLNPIGLDVSPDGTKLVVVVGLYLQSYTMSTPYDASTASYDNYERNLFLDGFSTSGRECYFGDNGLRLYIVDWSSNIRSYTLSVAYDVSTSSYDSKISTGINATYGVAFNSDGTKLFAMNATRVLHEYPLSIPWDIESDGASAGSYDLTSLHNAIMTFDISSDGRQIFAVSNSTDTIYQLTMTTPWDITTVQGTSKTFVAGNTTIPYGFCLTNDEYFFLGCQNQDNVDRYDANPANSNTTETLQIDSITVADGKTTLSFTANATYNIKSIELPDNSISPATDTYSISGSAITYKSDRIAFSGNKRHVRLRITGDNGETVTNAKLNLWKVP